MFKNLNIKKILSSFLSIALLFSCAPSTSASSPQGNKNSFPESVKSVVSSPKFIVPTAIVGAISATAITSHIYNTKFTKPRNPIENGIGGVTDERVNEEYDRYFSATYSPNVENSWEVCYQEPHKKYTYTRNFTVDAKRDKELEPKINEILQKMNRHGCKTDFEKAVFVHDYIYDHCKYTIGTVIDALTGNRTNFDPPDSHNALGCLINGKACCEGIADAYMLLLTRVGVECRCIEGGIRGGRHAWNIVKINGQWYHVDVTFDLFLKAAHSRYKWFMLSEEEISKDHNNFITSEQ